MLGSRESTGRLRAFVVTAIAALSAVLGPSWQMEGAAVGGSVVGAAAILGTEAPSSRKHPRRLHRRWTWRGLAFTVGAALAYEPARRRLRRSGMRQLSWERASPAAAGHCDRRSKSDAPTLGSALVVGIAPLVLGMARVRGHGTEALGVAFAVAWAGERGASAWGSPFRDRRGRIGLGSLLGVLGVMGAVLAILVPEGAAHGSCVGDGGGARSDVGFRGGPGRTDARRCATARGGRGVVRSGWPSRCRLSSASSRRVSRRAHARRPPSLRRLPSWWWC